MQTENILKLSRKQEVRIATAVNQILRESGIMPEQDDVFVLVGVGSGPDGSISIPSVLTPGSVEVGIRSLSLKSLKLGVRIENALNSYGLDSVGKIIDFATTKEGFLRTGENIIWRRFSRIRNLGPKGYRHIRNQLNSIGVVTDIGWQTRYEEWKFKREND